MVVHVQILSSDIFRPDLIGQGRKLASGIEICEQEVMSFALDLKEA